MSREDLFWNFIFMLGTYFILEVYTLKVFVILHLISYRNHSEIVHNYVDTIDNSQDCSS